MSSVLIRISSDWNRRQVNSENSSIVMYAIMSDWCVISVSKISTSLMTTDKFWRFTRSLFHGQKEKMSRSVRRNRSNLISLEMLLEWVQMAHHLKRSMNYRYLPRRVKAFSTSYSLVIFLELIGHTRSQLLLRFRSSRFITPTIPRAVAARVQRVK